MKDKRFAAIFVAILIASLFTANAAALSRMHSAGDLDDANSYLNAMAGMIRNRDAAGAQELGNKAIASIERAQSDEKDSGREAKMKEAVLRTRGAIGAAMRQDLGSAEGDVATALTLVNSLR